MENRRLLLTIVLPCLVLFCLANFSAATFTLADYNACADEVNKFIDNGNTFVLRPPAAPIIVNVNAVINSLTGINDNLQTLTLTFMLRLSWLDTDFKAKLADNITCVDAGYKYVIEKAVFLNWFPHFILANNDQVMYRDAWSKFPATMYANGTVVWQITLQAELECILDVNLFPFDYQQCKIEVAATQYNVDVMKFVVPDILRAVELDKAESGKSGVWNLAGQTYTPLEGHYPGISFKLLFQRKPTFYIISIILPLLAINIMTAITFVLPGGQHEKMSTSQMPVLCYFIINVFIYSYMPSSDSQPYLNIFLTVQMFLAAVASGLTAFLFKMRTREKEMKKMGVNQKEIRARFKILAICNTMNINTLSLIGYSTCALACWLATALYLGVGSGRQRKAMDLNYQPALVVLNSVPHDSQDM